jgi:hypothetical protein
MNTNVLKASLNSWSFPRKRESTSSIFLKICLHGCYSIRCLQRSVIFLFVVYLFIPGCATLKNNPDQAPLVLFDAFKEQVWPINDTGYAGYSSFNLFLKNLGYRTAENHKPYAEALDGRGSDTLFVLGVAMKARFSEDELEQVQNFVSRGGKVLIIAEHDNQYGNADFLGPLINAAGWEIDRGRIRDHDIALPGTDGNWIHTVLPSNAKGPVFLCAAELKPLEGKETRVLLKAAGEEQVIAGMGRYGKGVFVVMTDSEFLWNADPDYKWANEHLIAFNDPETKQFIRDLFLEIHPAKEGSREDGFAFSGRRENPVRVYVYGNGGDFSHYSAFLRALERAGITVLRYREGLNPGDRVIVLTPLRKIDERTVDELSGAGKIVMFADMYSSIKSYADSWELFFKPLNFQPLPYPANTVAEKFGIRFLPYYGVNPEEKEHGNKLYVPVSFNGKTLYLHKACAVELLEGNRNEAIVFENYQGTFGAGAGFGLNHVLTGKHPQDMENPEFMIATDRLLAIGDSDLVSNDFFQQSRDAGLIEVIIEFLKVSSASDS